MTFVAVGWLAGFVPLAAVVWWTLRRTPTTQPTTSAFLWPRTSVASSVRARRLPPAWTIAALLAITSAIVALAAPARRDQARVFVVIDPSFRAMSTAKMTWDRLARTDVALTLVVPGQPGVESIDDVRPTARSTDADVVATVARLRRDGRDVIAVTAARIEPDDRVRVIAPATPAVNAAIERIGARTRDDGSVDVFVRIARTLDAPAILTMRSGEAIVQQPIVSRDAFVRLPRATDGIEARVRFVGDGEPLDDAAWLTRDATSNVRVAIDGSLPASIERFAAAFTRVRPVDPTRPTTDVALTADPRVVGRAVIVGDGAVVSSGVLRRVEHPALANVDLDALPASDAAMPAGFVAIVWRGDRPVVATRDVGGRRAVWIGLAIDAAAREPAFVVLLDQAIAWTAGARGDEWSATTSDAVEAGWRASTVADARVEASPGVYVDGDGRSHAVNVPVATTQPMGGGEVDLSAWLASRRDRAARSIAAWPATAAAAFSLLATVLSVVPRGRPARLDVHRLAT